MTRFTKLLAGVAVGITALASIAASAHATTFVVVNSGWQNDIVTNKGKASVGSPLFFIVPVGAPAELFSLSDCCTPGDIYQVRILEAGVPGATFVDSVFALFPTPFPNNTGPFAVPYAADWTNPVYSHLQLNFTPGTYRLTVTDISRVGYPAAYGYRLDVPSAVTPEPATWALMMVGVGGIGFALRRKARKTAVLAA